MFMETSKMLTEKSGEQNCLRRTIELRIVCGEQIRNKKLFSLIYYFTFSHSYFLSSLLCCYSLQCRFCCQSRYFHYDCRLEGHSEYHYRCFYMTLWYYRSIICHSIFWSTFHCHYKATRFLCFSL